MSEIKAFFFDQDGVIVDTERDGHRVAFNRTFTEFGLDTQWSVEEYRELLQVGGGKERMAHYQRTKGFGVDISAVEVSELIERLHRRKTDIFIELLESGALPLRPGIRRIMEEAAGSGWMLGVCTTSSEQAARAIAHGMLKGIPFAFVLAGDVVKAKKPNPAIYLLGLEKTGLQANECVVFEDSHIGVTAAKAAGMHVVATTSWYTEQEDLSMADVVVNCLGEVEGPHAEFRPGGRRLDLTDGCVHAGDLIQLFSNHLK